jgi:hypothetical protein
LASSRKSNGTRCCDTAVQNRVAELVDGQVVVPEDELLFVTLELVLARHTGVLELHPQAEGDLRAGGLLRLILDHDHRVRGLAHEHRQLGRLQSLVRELLAPKVDGKGVVDPEIGLRHDGTSST